MPTNFLIRLEQPCLEYNVKVLFCSIFPSSDSALLCIDFFKRCPIVLLMTLVLGEGECTALMECNDSDKENRNTLNKNLSLCKTVYQKFETGRVGNEPDG